MTIKQSVISLVVSILVSFAANADVKPGKVNQLTQTEFKTLVHDYAANPDSWAYKGTQDAIIDFSATWCGPCKRLSPILDDLAKEYSGKIIFYNVDIDACRELAQAYGVSSVPTMLFCPADLQQ